MFKRFFRRSRTTPRPDPEAEEATPEETGPETPDREDPVSRDSSPGTESPADPGLDDEGDATASTDPDGEAPEPVPTPPPVPLESTLDAPRPTPERWHPLGTRAPGALADARQQLHHLVQVLAAFGGTFVDPQEDDSHRALAWSPELGGFRTQGAEVAGNVFMVVRPLPLEIQIRAVGDVHRYVLPGHTLQEAWDWAERELGLILGRSGVRLERPEYEIPDHRVAHHALFDASPAALEELSRWFDDAWLLLSRVARECPELASPVRSWPHHFDMATLLEFGQTPDGETCTVGVGLSAGDEERDEPYLYVTPWPRPEAAPDHDLPAGSWQESGWVGAVLGGTELVEGAPEDQEERARAFVDSALAEARDLLP